jgi:hypothetical protein
MWADMWRWGWYDYQWLLSFYLYTLLKKEKYILNKYKTYTWKDFSLFVNKISKFKQKCIHKYWKDFDLKFEVLVEWEEACLDDITFISNAEWEIFDNNIFIQVKTKWWAENNTITTSDGIYKAITNFLFNINFQRDKWKWNIIFFIFTNKDLSRPLLDRIKSKSTKLYLDFITHILKNNKNNDYPNTSLELLNIEINKSLITNILNSKNILIQQYLDIYSKEFLMKLINLTNDLKIIFNNLDIITKIDHEILKKELKTFHWKLDFFEEKERISELCFMWTNIKRWSDEFKRYENYEYTYFVSDNGWKFIHQIDNITKWKFI